VIAETIFEWAERAPAKPAVVYNGQVLSYRDFAANIAVARGYFARRGYVGPGIAVLAIINLLDFWVVSLALRSLGLTTIVVHYLAAFEILNLPAVRCVVASAGETMPGLAEACAARGYALLSISLAGEAPLGLNDIAPPERPGGHILQTSGTTGSRKKVLMDPAFEPAFMRERRELLGVDEHSVVDAFGFDAGTGVGYNSPVSTWLAGATVVIGKGLGMHATLLYPGITHAMVIPDLVGAILEAPEGAFPRSEIMHLSVTSGAMTRVQIDQAKARITPHIYNRVGSTEVNTWANTRLETEEDQRWHRLAPGRVLQVVDDFDRPVGPGEAGRVRVRTTSGPNGYLYDQGATKAFFKDGFFYPGDLAILREDGRIALQGRVTDVINFKGHKIMPAPMEERVREALGVSGVCLFTMQDDHGEEQLHLMIEAPAPIEAAILVPALRSELFGYPGAHVHFVATLPRNDTGKVVRREVVAQVLANR
jgi:acyl-coenzyme A synthetase/AMP-(fatty) acid ligase